MKDKLWIGKIVNYFGIKGELKVVSDFEMADRAFKENNTIYINNEKHLVTGCRFHHHNYLVKIDHINDINQITKYIGYDIYIDRNTLSLSDDEYLLDDLVGLDVCDGGEFIGKVESVNKNKVNPLIKVKGFYIPIYGNYIVKVSLSEKKIYCKNISGLML